jgi:parallel beta-helix repeat protein
MLSFTFLRKWLFVFLLIPLVLISSAQADASSWYVNAATGNDGNQGTTKSTPCQTISGCLNKNIQPGDTIYVAAGNYTCFGINKSGAAGLPITLTGDGSVTISGGTCGNGIFIGNKIHDITIQNLEIANFSDAGIAATGGEAYNLTISHNIIHGNNGGGIILVGSDCVTVSWNIVYENAFTAPNDTSGISLYEFTTQPNCKTSTDGFRNHVAHNEGYGNDNKFSGATDGNCIIIDDMRHTQNQPIVPYYGPTLIIDNYCHDNGGRGIHVYSSDNVSIQSNTATNNCKNLVVCPEDSNKAQGEINCNDCGGVQANYNLILPSSNEYGVAYRNQSNTPNSADNNQINISGYGDHKFDPTQGNTWGAKNILVTSITVPIDYSVVTEDASLLVQQALYQYYSGYPAPLLGVAGSPRNPNYRYFPIPSSRTTTVNCFTGQATCPLQP